MLDYGLVSIITPSWNSGKFIAATICSVLNQSYTQWELLIQDDCSTDNTSLIVKSFASADKRIKFESNVSFSGAAITRNNALQRAKGRWIAFLDSDDLWLPEKLAHQIKFMLDKNCFFSYHEYSEIGIDGCYLGIKVSGLNRVNIFSMYSCCWPGCLTVMYDAQRIGLIQIRDIRVNNDTAIWLKVVKIAPCYLLRENLALYRRRTDSASPNSFLRKIVAHYRLFRYAEDMSHFCSLFWTVMNILGQGIKKTLYVKKIC